MMCSYYPAVIYDKCYNPEFIKTSKDGALGNILLLWRCHLPRGAIAIVAKMICVSNDTMPNYLSQLELTKSFAGKKTIYLSKVQVVKYFPSHLE